MSGRSPAAGESKAKVKSGPPIAGEEKSLISKFVLPAILLIATASLLFQTTDLTRVDLGRHLKNGELLVHGVWAEKLAVLHTNFYSYTEGDFPFVNHHWLSGVVFYLSWRALGFGGLTLLYLAIVSLAVWGIYWIAQRGSSAAIAASLTALAVPLVAARAEVRPEAFTHLFSVIFYGILWAWHRGTLPSRWLYTLPLLMLLWVNLHIGFVFGFLVIGVFVLKVLTSGSTDRAQRLMRMLSVAGLCVASATLNPSFLRGLFYPLIIYRNYGIETSENQSLMTLQRVGLANGVEYRLFEALLVLAAASFVVRWLKPRAGAAPLFPEVLLFATLSGLALFAVRNIPVFCFLMIPIVAENIHEFLWRTKGGAHSRWMRIAALAVLVLGVGGAWSQFEQRRSTAGVGLRAGAESTAEFLNAKGIAGPVFNDIDIGGYLIFHLVHREGGPNAARQVFVDARPEAYSEAFLKQSYNGALSEEKTWREMDSKYQFNAVVFSLGDAYAPVERFLLNRVHDPEWAPVFGDDYSLILVRRNARNQDVIRGFEMPQDRFRR